MDYIKENSLKKKKVNWSLSIGQRLVIVLVLFVCVFYQFLFIKIAKDNQYKNEVAAAQVYGEALSAGILLTLDQSINITETLKSLYIEYGDLYIEEFDRLCGCLADGNLVIGSLYHAPEGIIRKAYPAKVNDSTIGFNMLEDPEQGERARLALESKKITVAGPHALVEGGTGFIIRNPIFNEDGSFNGFSIIVLDWNQFIKRVLEISSRESPGYYFGVWKKNDPHAITDVNGFILSNTTKPISKTIDIEINVPNDIWHLSVEPVEGWFINKSILNEVIVSFLVVLLIVVFTVVRQIESAKKLYNFEHDSLTGLLTRSAFHRRVKALIKENPHQSYDIMVADVENFKVANSIYGTKKCDELLCYLGECFSTTPDMLYCSRYGGDQFIAIFRSEDNHGLEYLEKRNKTYIENAPIKNIVIKYGLYGNIDKSIPVNLISDRALMASKSILHNNNFIIANYEGPVSKRHLQEQILESSFESALEKGDFKVWFQPKFDAKTEKLVGAEALVRWIDKDGNIVSPADFIYVFEEDGLITRLDEYVFRKVCEIIKYWIDKGIDVVPISVNLSKVSLHHKDVIKKYVRIVEEVGIPIKYVPLELTESVSYSNAQMKVLAEDLKAEGFVLEMDDFGTGSSSLVSLNILPFDKLKIDKSLVDFIGTPEGEELLRHAIELAHFKKMFVIAEGVEKKEQLDFLRSLDCDAIQGYYFAAPMPYEKTVEYLKTIYKEGRV